MIRRRELIALLGVAAAAWPLTAQAALASEASGQRGDSKVRAQQSERMRRIGVLMPLAEDDQEARTLVTAFVNGLQEQGWTVGRNVSVDYRWAPSRRNWSSRTPI